MPHIRAVVFDMDGVVIDSHPAHREAWRDFLHDLHRDVDERDLDYILDGRKREDILQHFLGYLTPEQLRTYGKQKDALFLRQSEQVRPMPGLLGFLLQLRRQRIPLALATSASATRTHSTLARLNLLSYFTAVLTANDVEESKPDPAIYRLACNRLFVSPHEAIAVEDGVSGIQAAKTAGLFCVAVDSEHDSGRLLAAGADIVIRHFNGLTPQMLERWLETQNRKYA